MKISATVLFALPVVLALAAPVRAQLPGLPGAGPRRYVEFDVPESAADFLKSRKELDRFKDLVKEIVKDPSKLPINLDKLKEKKIDEKQKRELQEWLTSDKDLREALSDLVKQKPPDQATDKDKEFQKNLTEILEKAKEKSASPNPDHAPDVTPEPQGGKEDDESLAKLTERAMKQAEGTRLGDWLRDSPAWNRAFDDLRSSMSDPRAGRLSGNVLNEKLGRLDSRVWKLGEGAFERLKELPRPNLEQVKIPGPKLGNLQTPNLTVPRMPDFSGPSLPSMGNAVLWLLLILLFLLGFWLLRRWSLRVDERAEERARLGPWPVNPAAVGTRSELIRAFDYLALLTLGFAVQSWNHHAVVRLWGEKAPQFGVSAQALAQLYEQARYTDGAEDLTEPQRDLARQTLLQLKEAL